MKLNLKPLSEQVIVITGATSGIGLTTAQMAAERGARVVLSARNEQDLREACDGIRERGGRATGKVADVADEWAMEDLARHAVSEFGRIDTWVNNAGVSIYGRLTEVPLEDKRRLFDVNFWGVVHGCRVALPHLRRRGGALINIGSVVSDRAIPLQGIYSASKHAVKAYTDTLRMELEQDGVPVSVTLVKPAAIDTPYPEHARNYMEQEAALPPPVYRPEEVAHAILAAAEKPVREITVGGGGRAMALMGMLAPRVTDLYMERTMFTQQQKDEPDTPGDSLETPGRGGRRRGDHEGYVMKRSAYTRAMLSDVARVLPVVLVGVAAAGYFGRR
jgi:NAD(P)-dependent dehydrogenase (short-subunit alcohol dehydrogenase family)